MTGLTEKKCVPCEEGTPALKGGQLKLLLPELGSGWRVVEEHHLEREFKFPDFRQALAFTNDVGELAEAEGHHPDIYLTWGKVKLTLWTHQAGGLTENDFVLAAKINKIGNQ